MFFSYTPRKKNSSFRLHIIKQPTNISNQEILNMQRSCITFLQDWLKSANRKPLVIRGARQVGKTWLVQYFAKLSGKQLIELNFLTTTTSNKSLHLQ
jgi:predicted AAA+ superfamily ATPase